MLRTSAPLIGALGFTESAVARLPCLDASKLEAIARVVGDTARGLSGSEIAYVLVESRMADPTPNMTKWKRLFNAFAEAQNKHQTGSPIVLFLNRAMSPGRHLSSEGRFEWLQDNLNVALSLAGYGVRNAGQIVHTSQESTVEGAKSRAKRLRTLLAARNTHSEILKYCDEELLKENYFHAVLEAVKGVAQRLREMTGLTTDGADLVNEALSTKNPRIRLNSLTTDTEISEQKGISNMLVGVFGAIRNPTAHAPKILWPMPEQDAVDIFGILSYVHRKLDNASATEREA